MIFGFYLFILYIYFVFVECICLGRIGFIFFFESFIENKVIKIQFCIKWDLFGRIILNFIEIFCWEWELCYLVLIKKSRF